MNLKPNRMFKALKGIIGGVGMVCVLHACTTDPNSPGLEYMPDMYRSVSHETYGATTEADKEFAPWKVGMTALTPPANTIPRGFMPYPYPNTTEGYDSAGANLKNPLAYSEANIKEGERLYNLFCDHCHGKKGEGDGPMTKGKKVSFPPPPAYSTLMSLPEGKMFHTTQYGKGMMGSHASQLTKEERWKIIHYIMGTLQKRDMSAYSKK